MIKKEEVFKIGRLGKPHGVKGEILFYFDDDIFDRVDCDYLVIEREGILVPFFMDEYRFHHGDTALLTLRDVESQEKAAELTGSDVFFPRELAEQENEAPILTFLVGFEIIDATTQQEIGTIEAINTATTNILFELDNGNLIPANDDLIVNIDTEQEKIIMTLPEGLLSLNDTTSEL